MAELQPGPLMMSPRIRWCREVKSDDSSPHASVGVDTASRLSPLPLGLGFLTLSLHRRLLVIRPPSHLLEDTRIVQFALERLEGRLNLIVQDRNHHTAPWSRVWIQGARRGGARVVPFGNGPHSNT